MQAIWFMLFSTFETLAIYSLIMTLLRFKTKEYIWQALVIMILANLQSFIMRNELQLDFLAPLITVLIFVFLFSAIIKIPVIWSAICTIIGYMLYALIQSAYLSVFFGSIDTLQTNPANGYILQLLSGATGLLISWVMYKFRIGFKYDLEKLRIKSEHILLIALIIVVLMLMAILFYLNRLWLHLLFFGITFGIFLYYAINTEERGSYDHRRIVKADSGSDKTTDT
ncbi:hypothetical protein PVOR_11805 [Paenibacillus vortex V453]|uniref:Uncharacterized protein n=2 Tax=Paenibacillus TaxID=44249 RepID=A0A163L480_9BACL|nr:MULTISPECIES: hypothetical protein [Paenibacillus]EFU41625.1 hypothetical protein PVOR_11805 [Paenibacillus vortex V453]KZS47798.1 hypothetical protein AWU65_18665 [Paenibacillus glucanolyticus]MDH6672792.1 hypothetical protein [Paenibacillus sp. LBL]